MIPIAIKIMCHTTSVFFWIYVAVGGSGREDSKHVSYLQWRKEGHRGGVTRRSVLVVITREGQMKGIVETNYFACELLGSACPLETNAVVR